MDTAADGVQVHQVEIAVAKRGEDPGPGLRALLALLAERPSLFGYAEIPLTWGLWRPWTRWPTYAAAAR